MPKAGNGRVGIRDVARMAGVSTGTVSRVANDHPDVSPAARQRVQEAIDRLGYRPSPVGRALSTRSIAAIGILIPDMTDPVFMPMAEGVESVASRHGYAVMLMNSNRELAKEFQFADLMAQFGVAGIIVIGGSPQHDHELVSRIGAIPTVLVTRRSNGGVFPSATIDHCAAAGMAMGHLLELGHRRIGTVRGDSLSEAGVERQRGYVGALKSQGIELDPTLVSGGVFSLEAGIASTRALLDLPSPPTAIFFPSDELALGGLRVIKDRGFRVPEDISIASINDIPFAAIADPPLTTVHTPKREMGMIGMQMLIDLIEGRGPTPDQILGMELVVRGSTGPPAS